MFLTMFKKNIVPTMHISNVFGNKFFLNKLKFAINPMKFATNCDKSVFLIICYQYSHGNNIILQKHEYCKSQPFLTFWVQTESLLV